MTIWTYYRRVVSAAGLYQAWWGAVCLAIIFGNYCFDIDGFLMSCVFYLMLLLSGCACIDVLVLSTVVDDEFKRSSWTLMRELTPYMQPEPFSDDDNESVDLTSFGGDQNDVNRARFDGEGGFSDNNVDRIPEDDKDGGDGEQ